ncbi:hypothetical protein [Psychrobacillus psychrodurans]|uniref:hypothetical protein n=1 Tax=Psychrobacillus psychrodurans TaxID=126157 RepID=UPI003CFF599D
MKVYIDIKKISDAPIDSADIFEIPKFKRLKSEILLGNPTTYLVSGYRGVGKTSFMKTLVNKVKLELDEKDVNEKNKKRSLFCEFFHEKTNVFVVNGTNKYKVFIHINVGKYSSFSNVVRSLVREIYWKVTEKEKTSKILKSNLTLLSELKLTYQRTFEDVEIKENDIETIESIKTYLFSATFQKLLIRLSTLVVGSTALIEYIKEGSVGLKILIPLLIVAFFLFSFEYKKNKLNAKTKEMNRKTFYDDEIAEFQLARIIDNLYDNGIEIVFIIDELDKIEKDEDINNLISELKPLMLKGKSNFLLIFGQKMLYKYLMADIFDNNILSSIFSRNVHIPLLDRKGFENYLNMITIEPKVISEELLISEYLDEKILLSNRIFRKFISLVRNDIQFDSDGKTFIEISENNLVRNTNANLARILYLVEDEIEKSKEYVLDEGVKDFLISNLYNTISIMKRKQHVSFGIDEILEDKNFIEDEFASAYFSYIKRNVQSIINKMVNNGLLKEVVSIDIENPHLYNKDNQKPEYMWANIAKIEKLDNDYYSYLDEFIKFENWLKSIFNQLQEYLIKGTYNKTNSISRILNILMKEKVLSEGINKEFSRIAKVRNSIAHGEELNEDDRKTLLTFEEDLHYFKARIFEEVMIYTASRVNNIDKKYLNLNNSLQLFDMNIDNINFEFKLINSKSTLKNTLKMLEKEVAVERLYEVRMVILVDGEAELQKIKNSIEIIIGNNPRIKVKIIEKVNLIDLQDFLLVQNIMN